VGATRWKSAHMIAATALGLTVLAHVTTASGASYRGSAATARGNGGRQEPGRNNEEGRATDFAKPSGSRPPARWAAATRILSCAGRRDEPSGAGADVTGGPQPVDEERDATLWAIGRRSGCPSPGLPISTWFGSWLAAGITPRSTSITTGLALGRGSKGLHEVITDLQTTSDSSGTPAAA
jgi:hypothetical protein